ncbi:MAG: hypothetical protein RML36_15235 [Anaerolineae bacterium]|nr:hypothetical protein [Anaerolineae bacterium]
MANFRVGERRKILISFDEAIGENISLTSVAEARERNGVATVVSASVISGRISVGDETFYPGRAVLLTMDFERAGVGDLGVLVETNDGQRVGFSRKFSVSP